MCMGERVIGVELAKCLVDIWLECDFAGGGGEITYQVKVTDKNPIEGVSIAYAAKGETREYWHEMSYNKKSGYYECSIKVPKGSYSIVVINAADIYENTVNYYNSDFEVDYFGRIGPEYNEFKNYDELLKTKNLCKYDIVFDK